MVSFKNNKLTLPIFSIVYLVEPKFKKSFGKEIEIAISTNLREIKKEFFHLVQNKKDMNFTFSNSKIYLKNKKTNEIISESTLSFPEKCFMQKGGKTGSHSENMLSLLTELQYMQRAYPGCEW